MLDVGFGSNIHISNTFAIEGLKACAMDEQQGDYSTEESIWHAPRKVRTNEKGVEILNGDVADIDSKGSAVKEQQFGLILFNGSWISGGNNWTVAGEVLEAKYHNKQNQTEAMVRFMDKEKEIILQSCKKHLTSNGLIGMVSSRYAFHGAGHGFDQLPEEKLSFIDLFNRFQRLGAKKIFLVGVTQDGFNQILTRSIEQYPEKYAEFKLTQEEIDSTRTKLKSVSDLPIEDVYSRYGDDPDYQKSLIRDSIEATANIPELNALARVDAIFAEF